MSLSICITSMIQHCNKKGKHPRGEIFTQRPDPAPSGRPGAGPGSEIQVVWREGRHGVLPLLHFVCSPLLRTPAQPVRWERSWSIPESRQAQGLRWAIAAAVVLFSQRRLSEDGAAAAAPLGVVQCVHLVFQPIDVVEVRLPRILVVDFRDGDELNCLTLGKERKSSN